MAVYVVGTYHSIVGRLEESVYDLLIQAGRGALADAGVEARDIDGIWVGNFSGGGFNSQEHLAPAPWRSIPICGSSRQPGWKMPVLQAPQPSPRPNRLLKPAPLNWPW